MKSRRTTQIRTLAVSAGAFFSLSLSAFAIGTQDISNAESNFQGKVPDLTKVCGSVCPTAKNNDEVMKCISQKESGKSGESLLKTKDKACYDAEKQVASLSGKDTSTSQQAGQVSSDTKKSAETANSKITPQSEPYRYG